MEMDENESQKTPEGDGSVIRATPSEGSEIIKALMAVDIAEVYSPPRVTAEAAKLNLRVGEAMAELVSPS